MTLTVRLDTALESALDRYSSAEGLTKSHVVQEALAEYLTTRSKSQRSPGDVSESYKAFERAGLVGCIETGGGADKPGIRTRIAERLARKRARRS